MRYRMLVLALIPIFAVGGAVLAWPEKKERAKKTEVEIKFDQAPKAVQDAIRKVTQSKDLEIDKVTMGGVVVYDVEYPDGKTESSMTLAETGEIIVTEKKMSTSDLPAAVKKAMGEKGKLVDAELVTVHAYKVVVLADGKRREFRAFASGQVDDDRDDDDDDDRDDDDDDDDDDKDDDD